MSRKSHNQVAIEDMDPRVVALAAQLIQWPAGLVRDGAIVQLTTKIQDAVDAWFAEMER